MHNQDNLKERLCMVGPMLGRNEGWVTTQGEILADRFREADYPVLETSPIVNRYKRLVDTVYSLLAWRNQYDLAIISVYSGPAFFMADISSFILKKLNKPVIMVLRGGNLPEFADSRKKWVKRVLGRARTVVSPSLYLSRFCESMNIKVTVIPNTIKLDRYSFRLRRTIRPKILWMRTFHEIYHPEMAVEVIDQLIKAVPDIHLTMAGQEKGRLASVQRLVREKGLQDKVSFEGFLKIQDKQKLFAEHDIYLNTTRIDNAPVSVIEAAAFGLPVVSTNVGGIPDLLTAFETGLLVPDQDVDAMAKAVNLLFLRPDLVEKLSGNGRKLAETCAWQNVLGLWQKIFFNLMNDTSTKT